MLKFNMYSDFEDFENFNLFDFKNRMIYGSLGKLCRSIQLPEGFAFPIGQILQMWSLFSKYEGMDETKEFHKYLAPTMMPTKYQVRLFFRDTDKALAKVVYDDMEFPVDVFESCFFSFNQIS